MKKKQTEGGSNIGDMARQALQGGTSDHPSFVPGGSRSGLPVIAGAALGLAKIMSNAPKPETIQDKFSGSPYSAAGKTGSSGTQSGPSAEGGKPKKKLKEMKKINEDQNQQQNPIPQTPKAMTSTDARLRGMASAMGINHQQLANPIFYHYMMNMQTGGYNVAPAGQVSGAPGSPAPVPLQAPTTAPQQNMQKESLINKFVALHEKSSSNLFEIAKQLTERGGGGDHGGGGSGRGGGGFGGGHAGGFGGGMKEDADGPTVSRAQTFKNFIRQHPEVASKLFAGTEGGKKKIKESITLDERKRAKADFGGDSDATDFGRDNKADFGGDSDFGGGPSTPKYTASAATKSVSAPASSASNKVSVPNPKSGSSIDSGLTLPTSKVIAKNFSTGGSSSSSSASASPKIDNSGGGSSSSASAPNYARKDFQQSVDRMKAGKSNLPNADSAPATPKAEPAPSAPQTSRKSTDDSYGATIQKSFKNFGMDIPNFSEPRKNWRDQPGRRQGSAPQTEPQATPSSQTPAPQVDRTERSGEAPSLKFSKKAQDAYRGAEAFGKNPEEGLKGILGDKYVAPESGKKGKKVKEAVDEKTPNQKTGPRIKDSEPGTKCSNPVPTRDLTDSVNEAKKRTEGGESPGGASQGGGGQGGGGGDMQAMAQQMMGMAKGGGGGGKGPAPEPAGLQTGQQAGPLPTGPSKPPIATGESGTKKKLKEADLKWNPAPANPNPIRTPNASEFGQRGKDWWQASKDLKQNPQKYLQDRGVTDAQTPSPGSVASGPESGKKRVKEESMIDAVSAILAEKRDYNNLFRMS